MPRMPHARRGRPVILVFLAAGVAAGASTPALGQNTPPATPVVTEPQFDGRIVNPEDTHMECVMFSDPDEGDEHACSDWEIWTVTPPQRVWASLCVTGPEMVHIHLGDGVFEGSHAGRASLMPSTNYVLRVRHKDGSGDPATEWSGYGERTFITGQLSSIFPMELDDILDSPAPTWVDTTGVPIALPAGGAPGELRLESGAGEPMLVIAGEAGGGNRVTNPGTLAEHVPARIRLIAGGQPIILPETDLGFTDHTGIDRMIYLPPVNLAPGESAYLWVAANGSTYHAAAGQNAPSFASLARGVAVPWTVRQPGFKVEIVASGFQLPVNIAFVPNPGNEPESPLFYVTELYGEIKVVRRDGTVGTYASNLINFNPTGAFPGSGEQGVTGIVVEPVTGDVFASMLYDATPPNGPHYPKIVRFTSNDGGQTAATQTVIRNMVGETQGQSHQISNLSIGPDGKLYVHMGDGFIANTAQNLDSYRGKILRMNLNGTAPSDNPFYNASNGINARDYIFASGMRNPFGGDWREADGKHYQVENGPSVDRITQVVAGRNYLWNGSDASMTNFALYNWNPAAGPVNMAFIQPGTFGGSRFPESKMGHMFISESGPTWASGPQPLGKRISEFVLDAQGNIVGGPTPLIEYNGSGKATVAGLAAGPDGLYFTDLYKDEGYGSPVDRGANVLRVRFVGAANFAAQPDAGPSPLTVQFSDLSTVPSPTAWLWSFGDGQTSTERNPTHTYEQEGFYNVRLTVTGSGGAAVLQRNAYIKVGQVPKIALIGGTNPPSASDLAVAEHLRDVGFTVDHYDDEPANRPSAHQLSHSHDLVVVSSTVTSGNIAGEFRTESVPLIFWEQGLLLNGRENLASGGAVAQNATTISILTTAHPITQGLAMGGSHVFQPGANMSVGTGTFAPGATLVARRAASSDAAILAAEAGATLLNGYTAPARRVFLFFEDTSFLSATPATAELLKRAVCWGGDFYPAVDTHPSPLALNEGDSAVFTVGASGAGPITYTWERDGVPLASGGRIAGATTGTLTITNVRPEDVGVYRAVVTNACGRIITDEATLDVTPRPSCPADWNQDTAVNSGDISAFLTSWIASVTEGTPEADFDGDGTVNSGDISVFLTAWIDAASGGCR